MKNSFTGAIPFIPHFITGKQLLLLLEVLRSQAQVSLPLSSCRNGNLLAPFTCHVPNVKYNSFGPSSQDNIVDSMKSCSESTESTLWAPKVFVVNIPISQMETKASRSLASNGLDKNLDFKFCGS